MAEQIIPGSMDATKLEAKVIGRYMEAYNYLTSLLNPSYLSALRKQTELKELKEMLEKAKKCYNTISKDIFDYNPNIKKKCDNALFNLELIISIRDIQRVLE